MMEKHRHRRGVGRKRGGRVRGGIIEVQGEIVCLCVCDEPLTSGGFLPLLVCVLATLTSPDFSCCHRMLRSVDARQPAVKRSHTASAAKAFIFVTECASPTWRMASPTARLVIQLMSVGRCVVNVIPSRTRYFTCARHVNSQVNGDGQEENLSRLYECTFTKSRHLCDYLLSSESISLV